MATRKPKTSWLHIFNILDLNQGKKLDCNFIKFNTCTMIHPKAMSMNRNDNYSR